MYITSLLILDLILLVVVLSLERDALLLGLVRIGWILYLSLDVAVKPGFLIDSVIFLIAVPILYAVK